MQRIYTVLNHKSSINDKIKECNIPFSLVKLLNIYHIKELIDEAAFNIDNGKFKHFSQFLESYLIKLLDELYSYPIIQEHINKCIKDLEYDINDSTQIAKEFILQFKPKDKSPEIWNDKEIHISKRKILPLFKDDSDKYIEFLKLNRDIIYQM